MPRRVPTLLLAATLAALTACAPSAATDTPVDLDSPDRKALVRDATTLLRALHATERKTGHLPAVDAGHLTGSVAVDLTPPNYVHTYLVDTEDPAFCLANDNAGVWVSVPIRTGIITSSGPTTCEETEHP